MDSPAVKAYRDQFKLNCSLGRKYDIDATVEDLELWKFVISHWGYWSSKGKWVSFSPLSIGKMLSEYSRLEGDKAAQQIAGYIIETTY